MSALGQYVHLSWKNYENAGILRTTTTWTKTGKNKVKSDQKVNVNIFINFIEHLKNKKIDTLNSYDLDALTKWYNTQRKKIFSYLKNADVKVRKDFFKLIVEEALKGNKKNKFENELADQVEFIVDHMKLDDTTGNIKFDTSMSNIGLIKIPKLRGQERVYLDTFLRDGSSGTIPKEGRLTTLKQEIEQLKRSSPSGEIINTLTAQLKSIEDIFTNIKKYTETRNIGVIKDTLNKFFSSSKTKELDITNLIWLSRNGNILLKAEFANWLLSLIVGLHNQISFSRFQEKIMSVFSEAMAPAVGAVAQNVAETNVGKFLQTTLLGLKGSNKGQLDSNVQKLQQETLKKYFPLLDGNNDFGFSMAITRAEGKVDGVIDYNGAKINASIKNYNLDIDSYRIKGQNVPARIGLVTKTPLTSLLFGAEAMSSEKFGTHFLNVFAAHTESKDGKYYEKLRKDAVLALKLLTLYNGFTGGGGIKDQDLAEILIIDSKTEKGKSYFFSIKDLLTKAYDNILNNFQLIDEHFFFNASRATTFDNIFLKNDKVTKNKQQSVNVKNRISSLLMDAHKEKISAAINLKYIKSKL